MKQRKAWMERILLRKTETLNDLNGWSKEKRDFCQIEFLWYVLCIHYARWNCNNDNRVSVRLLTWEYCISLHWMKWTKLEILTGIHSIPYHRTWDSLMLICIHIRAYSVTRLYSRTWAKVFLGNEEKEETVRFSQETVIS